MPDTQGNATPHREQPGLCWGGGFHLESRKTLPPVSKATGLSEQSAWLCTRVGHVSQPSRIQRGPASPAPALRPAMALIKWFPKARATAVKGSPANWSINSADSQGSREPPSYSSSVTMSKLTASRLNYNCRRLGGGWRGARNALAAAQAHSWRGRGFCLALLSFSSPQKLASGAADQIQGH